VVREVPAQLHEELFARRQRAILVVIDWDVGKGKSSLAFVGDEIEYVGAEGLEDGLTIFTHEVGVRASCKSDSEVR